MPKRDSRIVDAYTPSLGVKLEKYDPRTEVHAIVIHNTGYGPIRRFKNGQYDSPMEAALAIYTTMMKAGPHYVVDQKGEAYQVCPEELAAWHVGSRGGRRYTNPQRKWMNRNTKWWRVRWPTLQSPRELANGKLWDGNSVNKNTLGIEVVPNPDNPYGEWTPECWETLVELCLDLCVRHELPFTREHIVSHSDAHPRARSKKGIPWDPWPEQWSFEWLCRYGFDI